MTLSTPQQTARDLRTAAQVSEAAGHTKGELAEFQTGRLCAAGALNIAVGQAKLITHDSTFTSRSAGVRFSIRFIDTDNMDSARINAAARALAPQLPEPCEECLRDYGNDSPAVVRLIHFNDHVCEGGEELQLLFIQGAEKLEADL